MVPSVSGHFVLCSERKLPEENFLNEIRVCITLYSIILLFVVYMQVCLEHYPSAAYTESTLRATVEVSPPDKQMHDQG